MYEAIGNRKIIMAIDQRKLLQFLFFYLSVLLFLYPYAVHYIPEVKVCFFSYLTGHPSPTCGATRAIVSLLHLEIKKAFLFNPLAAIIWLVLFFFTATSFYKPTIIKVFIEKKFLRRSIFLFCFAGLLNWLYLWENEAYLQTHGLKSIQPLF
ncbi:MAG: DUF2752 domain-containing protein [Nitrospinae bacterium]|nr:DUF2752 domain-containing protein [Nitrospinota bacterium]